MAMTQGKVSMVVPCYNKAPYVEGMMQSIYVQKWDNIELILVNDGSTDGTREIIGEWEPKFIERGYEVVIIDQKNQGAAAAVYKGMQHMSGEYFCTVDCDDRLDPAYVSTMAGWLVEHLEYEWAACGCAYTLEKGEKVNIAQFDCKPDMPQILENYMFYRIITSACVYIVRTNYIKKCEVLNVHTMPCVSQEPQIIVPLAAGEGKLKYFEEALYLYNLDTAAVGRKESFAKTKSFHEQYFRLIEKSIERLCIADMDKQRFLILAQIAKFKILLSTTRNFLEFGEYGPKLIEEMTEAINRNFVLPQEIQLKNAMDFGEAWFPLVLKKWIFGEERKPKPIPQKHGKIIGYGSMGKVAQKLLPLLMGTPLMPMILWDNAATPDVQPSNAAVTKPEFALLTEEDVIIVFPKDISVLTDLQQQIKGRAVQCFLRQDEVKRFLEAYYFPQLQGDCMFVEGWNKRLLF
ncbi:MAG: glycosyltransferase family 2 protein [Clostridiales Family XIII bacterium]|jgi:glycosyltransferase involved in cell wall biosynthesis|nr:glycosyltransferase family 2 protein [Clostridiales Family XIII bacterium]